MIQLLRLYTEVSGLRVIQALEGQEVLPLAQVRRPAVVLLQMDLAGSVRGWDALRALKADPLTWEIPVLIISWQTQGMLNELAEGAAGYLQEPITYEAFVEALQRLNIRCPAEVSPEPAPSAEPGETPRPNPSRVHPKRKKSRAVN